MPEFKPLMEDQWKDYEKLFNSTSAMFRLTKQLKALKQPLRALSKMKLGDISRKTGEAYQVLCQKQGETLNNPTMEAMRDGNNKFFQNSAKLREIRNAIHEIQRADGSLAKTDEEIKAEAESFFAEFMTKQPDDFEGVSVDRLKELLGYQCSEMDCRNLEREVTREEIKEVIFHMPGSKSPGPDVYTSEFFKEAWEVIGDDVIVAIQSFFVKGFLPKGVNSTILALIPKKEESKMMKDYRPISCCNVLYKAISMIIANRVFADGTRNSIEGILREFDDFDRMSGLKISMEKSTLFMAGNMQKREEILRDFQFATGSLPVRYLGLPLLTKRMTVLDYLPLIEKIRKRVSSWTGRLPSGCIKEIERLCSSFLWSGPELNGRKTKVVWRDVCRTKQESGLGVRPLKEENTQSGSWMWKKLLKCREIAKSLYQVEVRNGKKASFWFEAWSPMGRLQEVLSGRGHIDLGIRAKDTVEACKSHRRRHHRVHILNAVELEIEKMKEKWVDEEDVSLWRNEKGRYKAAFFTCDTWQNIREKHLCCSWHSTVWFKHAIPKYAFVTWMTSFGDCRAPFFKCPYSMQIWEVLMEGVLQGLVGVRAGHPVGVRAGCLVGVRAR
ncbi:uncharacterized protein LOC106355467 [Brassica napus]|uniref:uncharacterized protein LOC106355467 n=1 Tax=Brassica napus TaxID=3708 RepID=UPI0004F14421|nr:uncharacterized protein LOC106355467 [Brassica napus]